MMQEESELTSSVFITEKKQEGGDWANLPSPVLVEVYKKLNDYDRRSMALTCKAWEKVESKFLRHVL